MEKEKEDEEKQNRASTDFEKEIVYCYLKSLKVSESNIREDFGDMISFTEQIRNSGWLTPLLINSNNEIMDGHRRYNALIFIHKDDLEDIKIPCILSDKEPNSTDEALEGIVSDAYSKKFLWWELGKLFHKLHFMDNVSYAKISRQRKEDESSIRQKAIAYSLVEDKLLSKDDLKKYFSNYKILYKIAILKFPQIAISFYDETKEQNFLKKERKALILTVINYLKENPKKKITKENIIKRIINASNMIYKFNLIETTHNGLYDLLYDFWYPLRYLENSYKDMEEEADLRIGHPHRTEYYYDVDKITEEEAKKKAEEKHGEFRGILTFKRYVIYGLKRTAKEIRNKYAN